MNDLHYTVLKEDFLKPDLLFKIILIGPSYSGKSCLLLREIKYQFRDDYEVTIGAEFGSLFLRIENKIVKVQIWDTTGSEAYKSVTKIFFKGANAAFLIYDITSEESFKGAKEWLDELRFNSDTNTKIYLIGNKSDLNEERKISMERGQQFVNDEKLAGFFETSAKTGDNVHLVFIHTILNLYKENSQKMMKQKSVDNPTQLNPNLEPKPSNCPC